jgi:hypothetical protein
VDGLSETAKPQNPAESGIFREIRRIRAIRVKNFPALPDGSTSFTHEPKTF